MVKVCPKKCSFARKDPLPRYPDYYNFCPYCGSTLVKGRNPPKKVASES